MSAINSPVLRVVLDTSVVVAALRSRAGASNEILRLVSQGRVVALATPALFLEYEDVLARPEQRTAHGLDDLGIGRFLQALASVIEPVTVHIGWRPQLRDPSDEMVLEAAINGGADAIVTFNVRDFVPAGRFGITVMRPGDLLVRVRS
jgi:putative PIN family toxin of toxin-antitoxin system